MKALRHSRQGKLKAFRPSTGGDKMDSLVLEMVNRTGLVAYLPINRMQSEIFGLKLKQRLLQMPGRVFNNFLHQTLGPKIL